MIICKQQSVSLTLFNTIEEPSCRTSSLVSLSELVEELEAGFVVVCAAGFTTTAFGAPLEPKSFISFMNR